MLKRVMLGVAALGLLTGTSAAQDNANPLDEALPNYESTQGVTGSIKSMGSDTMNNIMTLWGELFMKAYPGVSVEVIGKGSSTAPPALTEGQAQFGPMSREMKAAEVDRFEEVHGYKPTLLRTGIDCLAVFVHKDCPLESLSLDQVTEVFSVKGTDMTWGDLGVKDSSWRHQPVTLYGRNSASGTYGYFKQVALGGNDFKDTVKEQPGSSAVVQAVATDPYAIGYSGIGYATQDVKALALSEATGDEAFSPDLEHAYSGEYPLARFLLVYINNNPGRELEPLRAEFIKLIFSRQGQEAVLKDGYFPLPASMASEELGNVGL